ncbi:hypothetical protein K438DRAFT_1769356 [Mycena galopus ATCC 62051]|nr:hypothetical protein K438DRAFT_1769356 [Mycena galopus ATCC 62051]
MPSAAEGAQSDTNGSRDMSFSTGGVAPDPGPGDAEPGDKDVDSDNDELGSGLSQPPMRTSSKRPLIDRIRLPRPWLFATPRLLQEYSDDGEGYVFGPDTNPPPLLSYKEGMDTDNEDEDDAVLPLLLVGGGGPHHEATPPAEHPPTCLRGGLRATLHASVQTQDVIAHRAAAAAAAVADEAVETAALEAPVPPTTDNRAQLAAVWKARQLDIKKRQEHREAHNKDVVQKFDRADRATEDTDGAPAPSSRVPAPSSRVPAPSSRAPAPNAAAGPSHGPVPAPTCNLAPAPNATGTSRGATPAPNTAAAGSARAPAPNATAAGTNCAPAPASNVAASRVPAPVPKGKGSGRSVSVDADGRPKAQPAFRRAENTAPLEPMEYGGNDLSAFLHQAYFTGVPLPPPPPHWVQDNLWDPEPLQAPSANVPSEPLSCPPIAVLQDENADADGEPDTDHPDINDNEYADGEPDAEHLDVGGCPSTLLKAWLKECFAVITLGASCELQAL